MATKVKAAAKAVWDTLLSHMVEVGIVPAVVHRILLWGPPRTGKSSKCVALFPTCEQITFHRQMPVDDLIGSYALVNGTTVWQDGPAVRAMRNGRALIINEVDQYSGEIRCFLHDVMDDMNVCGVTLPNGERVTPRPGYCVVCTTNALPSSLPDAIYDRFDLVLKADTLSIGLQKMLGDFVEPAKSVIGGGSTYEWQRPASVNLYIAAQKMRQKGVTDTAIAEYLGLTGQTATDFLSVIAKWSAPCCDGVGCELCLRIDKE